MRAFFLALALAWMGVAADAQPSPAITYRNLNTNDFRVTNTIVSLRGSGPGGTNYFVNIVVSNLYTTNITVQNLYSSNVFTTNITAVTEYVTNIFNTYLVSSNAVVGNIQGTPPHLAKFGPDNFSLEDSIVTQNADTNGVTVNGTGDGSVTLGPSPGEITMARVGSDLQFTNAAGMFLKLGGSGNLLYWGNDNSNFSSFQNADHSSFGGVLLGTDGLNYLSAFSMASTTVPEEMQFILNVEATNLFYFAPRPNEIASPAVFYINSLVPVTNALLTAFANRTTNLFGVTYDGKIQVGGSATNLLYRTNAFVAYTNNATGVFASGYQAINGSGSVGNFGVAGSVVRISPEGAANAIDLLDTAGKTVRWWNNTWTPLNSSAELGHNGGGQYPWGDFKMSGTEYVYGFNPDVSDAFNYSRLAISHTGTNAWDTIRFDSQSAGTAGTVGRPFQFTNAPVMLPYVTKAAKTALTPIDGMIVYQTDNTPGLRAYINGSWVILSTAADP